MFYIAYLFEIKPNTSENREILMAYLSMLDFESFKEENNQTLIAYAKEGKIGDDKLHKLPILADSSYEIVYKTEKIAQENWNVNWEKNFNPIQIDMRCYVRAPFHQVLENIDYDLIIEPKMSFGTGHHTTTRLMLNFLLDDPVEGKTLLDMGCGTGILGILAKKKGAQRVYAIDIDAWAEENTLENAKRNQVDLYVKKANAEILKTIPHKFDTILANINRNVLLNDMKTYTKSLKKGGTLYLSGFYEKDIPMLLSKAIELGLKHENTLKHESWAALRLTYV